MTEADRQYKDVYKRQAQIRDLSKAIPLEAIVYGHLPLMLTENCIVHNHTGQHSCCLLYTSRCV